MNIKEKLNSKKSLMIISLVLLVTTLAGIGSSVLISNKKSLVEKELSELRADFNNSQLKLSKVEKEVKEYEKEVASLEKKIEEAKPYLELNEDRRTLVNAEIEKIENAAQEEIEKQKAEEEARKAQEAAEAEAKRLMEEAIKNSHIGEAIDFESRNEKFTVTIDRVFLTDERNMFSDEVVKNVVGIEYTVENIGSAECDVFLSMDADFYDSEGYKCDMYANENHDVYNLAPGMKEQGIIHIGIANSDMPYLEMHFGGLKYKWNLQ